MKRKRLLSCLLSAALLLSYLTVFPQSDAKAATNLAAGKLPIASTKFSGIEKATDGIKSPSNYTDCYPGSGFVWVQIDLGGSYDINNIKLWHYFGDGRTYHDVIVQTSNDPNFTYAKTVFNNDKDGSTRISYQYGAGTNNEYQETSAGLNIKFETTNARYIRFFSNGSTANNYNHYSEIEVYEAQITGSLTNLAANKPVTTSASFSDLAKANDAIKSTGNFADSFPANGLQWVQVDLLESCFIDTIKLWHYYGDGRTYHDVIVQISDDPSFATGVKTLFNNDSNNSSGQGAGMSLEYAEKASGLSVSGKMYGFHQRARYVRFYSAGSTANSSNHYGEIEIYGYTPEPATGNLAAGRPVFTSTSFANKNFITDGDTNTANFADSYEFSGVYGNGLQYVTIDLCLPYSIDSIKLWHYYFDGRKYHDVIVQLSNDPEFKTGVTTVFNNDTDNYAGRGIGKDSEYTETSGGLNLTFEPVKARYARFYSNGSTSNAANHYVDIQIYGSYAEHVAGNLLDGKKPYSTSASFNNTSLVTDGNKNTASFSDSHPNNGLQWMQMDLGASNNINNINLWHYYGDSRKYHDVIVQLSNDPTFATNVTTVFNNDADNSAEQGAGTDREYTETLSGLDISFAPVSARYARFYSNGSTANSSNHYVEIEMYGASEVVHPESVSLSKSTEAIAIGGTAFLSATVLPADASNKNVTWSSDAPDVAAVSQTGTVSGLKAGTAVITATTADGSLFSSCTVTVAAPVVHPTSISLGIDGASPYVNIHPGETYQLNATVFPEDTTNKNVIWSSVDESLATVSQTGLVTGVKEGPVTILAKTEDGGIFDGCFVVVATGTIHPQSVTLNKSSIVLQEGQTDTLTASVYPSNAENKSLVWASSYPDSVTVSQDGLVSAVSPYGATITATTVDGTLVASCDVRVLKIQPQGNLALGRLTDFPDPGQTSATFRNLSAATDGIKSIASFADSYPADGLQWIQMELNPNQSYDIGYIKLWHYFGDSRKYHDVIVQVSESPSFKPGSYITVYNNDSDNSAGQGIGTESEYSETSAGLAVEFPATKARYVRIYSNGSTANRSNHYSEIEVYRDKASAQ